MSEPMSDERLAELLDKAAKPWGSHDYPAELMTIITTRQAWQLASLSLEMAAEVERLRVREAALVEIVRAASMAEKIDLPELRDRARALLAGDGEREETQP